jgi:hypothetical protein
MWSPVSALARWQVIEAADAESGETPPLRVDPYIARFLQGREEIDPELLHCASYVEPRTALPRWPVEELSRRIHDALGQGLPNRIWLVGQRLSGRRTLAACVAQNLGSTLVAINTSRIGEREWPRLHVRIQRQALLHGHAIAWCGEHVSRAYTSSAVKG